MTPADDRWLLYGPTAFRAAVALMAVAIGAECVEVDDG